MKSVAFSVSILCLGIPSPAFKNNVEGQSGGSVSEMQVPLTQKATCHSDTFGEYALAPKYFNQTYSCGLEIVTALETLQQCNYL